MKKMIKEMSAALEGRPILLINFILEIIIISLAGYALWSLLPEPWGRHSMNLVTVALPAIATVKFFRRWDAMGVK